MRFWRRRGRRSVRRVWRRQIGLPVLVALVFMSLTVPAYAAVPEAFDDFYSTKVDVEVDIFLSAFDPDGDPITFVVTGGPSSGLLDDCSDGACTYTPNAGFTGTD
ncbi:MAG: Ig-like domain-containing protein, partial [Acidimicrobiia bacterium]|nr:Ig-like domain-containing protein [Acidimicrobiia bacterium]